MQFPFLRSLSLGREALILTKARLSSDDGSHLAPPVKQRKKGEGKCVLLSVHGHLGTLMPQGKPRPFAGKAALRTNAGQCSDGF